MTVRIGRTALAWSASLLICLSAVGTVGFGSSYAETPLSAFTATAPSIDGVVQASEWSDAAKLNITLTGPGPDIPATVYIMNDNSNIYLAVSTIDSNIEARSLLFQFDDNYNGILQSGEELLKYDPMYWSSAGLPPANFDWHIVSADAISESYDFDTQENGTIDGEAQGSQSSSNNDYEFSHPLCSSDTAYDFCLTDGATIGFAILYGIQGVGSNVWPSGIGAGQDASNYGQITVATSPSPPPPEPPSNSLPLGTNITTGYSPYPAETYSFVFSDPGPQSENVPAPSGGEADAIFVEVTTHVQNAVLDFDSDSMQYHYSVIPDANALLAFPESLNISNVRLSIDGRGYPDDAGHVGYILPPAPQQPPEQPPEARPAPPVEGQPLEADAGPDQTVDENQIVVLDGTGSSGSQTTVMSYFWKQIAGPKVYLHDVNSIVPSFSSPLVGPEGESLRFRLTVTDSESNSSSDTVTIFVRDVYQITVNRTPVADAGWDLSIEEGKRVFLSGTAYDPDGDEMTYSWTQTNGTTVSISNSTTLTPSFIAPSVPATESLTFQLSVKDSKGESDTDLISVTVTKPSMTIATPNQPPKVDAGKNMVVNEGSAVRLQGNASDPDGDAGLEYMWNQIQGPPVSLSDPFSLSTTFQSPEVAQGQQILIFELRVSDPSQNISSDNITIVVRDVSSVLPIREESLQVVSNPASTSPPESYSLDFMKSEALVADLPAPKDKVIGIWADVPQEMEGATIHFDSMGSNFYFDLSSGGAAGYLFREPLSFANATLTIVSLQTPAAKVLVGYYYEEPAITPIQSTKQITRDTLATPITENVPVTASSTNQESFPPFEYGTQLIRSITSVLPLPFLIIMVLGIVAGMPTSIVLAIRKSHLKNSIPKERRDAALEMAAILFPNLDPIAEEEFEKGPVIEELEQELGTTLNPATSMLDLLKKYTGETEINAKEEP